MSEYAIALGMFDSVHIGHRAVINEAVNSEYESLVVTFDKISYKGNKYLLTLEERKDKIFSLGVSDIWVLDFEEVKDLSPKEFLDLLLSKRTIRKVCTGFNFRFGKNAEGDTLFLRKYCEEKDIEFTEISEVKYGGETVSTTRIKELLSKGKVLEANELLGARFSFSAEVVEGDKRGRKLGFPTINQIYPEEKAKLKFGVYHTRVTVDNKCYDGVTNFGIRPTFQNDFISAETYIIDFSGDCYGKNIKLSFAEYIRDEKKFETVDELVKEVNENILYVKRKHPYAVSHRDYLA